MDASSMENFLSVSSALVSSTPPCVAIKTQLVRKATRNHLMNSISLEKTQSSVSGLCYAQNRVRNGAVSPTLNIFKLVLQLFLAQ